GCFWSRAACRASTSPATPSTWALEARLSASMAATSCSPSTATPSAAAEPTGAPRRHRTPATRPPRPKPAEGLRVLRLTPEPFGPIVRPSFQPSVGEQYGHARLRQVSWLRQFPAGL